MLEAHLLLILIKSTESRLDVEMVKVVLGPMMSTKLQMMVIFLIGPYSNCKCKNKKFDHFLMASLTNYCIIFF